MIKLQVVKSWKKFQKKVKVAFSKLLPKVERFFRQWLVIKSNSEKGKQKLAMYQKPQFSAPHFPSHFTEYSPISSFMLIARLQPPVSISSIPRETTITLNCWGEGIDNVILPRREKRDNLRQMKQRYFWQKKSLSSRKRQMMRKNEISEDDTDDGNDNIINRPQSRRRKSSMERVVVDLWCIARAMRNCIYQNQSKLLTSQKIYCILGEWALQYFLRIVQNYGNALLRANFQ